MGLGKWPNFTTGTIDGLLEGKSVEKTFSEISQDSTLSHAYLDKLKSIYTSPAYQESIQVHPLRRKRLKKEIIDAWVEEWRRMNRLSQRNGSLWRTSPLCHQGYPRTDSGEFRPKSTSRSPPTIFGDSLSDCRTGWQRRSSTFQ